MLLGWLGRKHGRADLLDAETAIDAAISSVLAVPESRTIDVGGRATTSACTAALVSHINEA